MENGTIKVTWLPDLNENGTKNVRRYIQYGSKTIGEAAAWGDLSKGRAWRKTPIHPVEMGRFDFGFAEGRFRV